ncbi:MAG: hypothetical protein LH478_06745 [Chitinophagaceae bacterium]|nr:hypothetical protein [Chitinophagaceae bacterium]
MRSKTSIYAAFEVIPVIQWDRHFERHPNNLGGRPEHVGRTETRTTLAAKRNIWGERAPTKAGQNGRLKLS